MSRLRDATSLVGEAVEAARSATKGLGQGGADDLGASLRSSSTFVRGLAVGALVGAAIAGSTIWERRRARRRIKRELRSPKAVGKG